MIYFLQFDKPLGNPQKRHGQAQYYIGWCQGEETLGRRLKAHQRGEGAAITRAAVKQGIGFKVIHTMDGDKNLERKLKNQKNTPRLIKRLLKGGNHGNPDCGL